MHPALLTLAAMFILSCPSLVRAASPVTAQPVDPALTRAGVDTPPAQPGVDPTPFVASGDPLPDLGGLLETVRGSADESAAALKAKDLSVFMIVTRMTPGYLEVSMNGTSTTRAGVLSRERLLLAGNRYSEIETGVTGITLTTSSTAVVTLWRRVTYSTINTPPTYVSTPQGMHVLNHTMRTERTQLLDQTWQQGQAGWMLSRSRIVKEYMVAVE